MDYWGETVFVAIAEKLMMFCFTMVHAYEEFYWNGVNYDYIFMSISK